LSDERREFQRLLLTRAIDGSFDVTNVRILDVSATGAHVELDSDLELGAIGPLRFAWRETVVEIQAEVARSDGGQAGLKFTEDSPVLRDLIAQSAKEVLRAQLANMTGEREQNTLGEETLTASSSRLLGKSGYVSMIFQDGKWKRRKALIGDQPSNGFTVSAMEPDDQVQLLCDTYEKGDENQRNLTRLLAELSCATVRPSDH